MGLPSRILWQQTIPGFEDTNSIFEEALKLLRADILTGRLPPGTKLVSRDLSQNYRVGLSPLRDALGQLAGTGLVVREAQRGFRVAPVSREDLLDVTATRKMVELAAFDASLQRADKHWARRVQDAHQAFMNASRGIGDNRPISEDWEIRHREFHFALLSGCESTNLFELCCMLHDKFDRYRRLALPTRSYTGAVDQDHEVLLNVALSGDRPEALRLLGQHIDDTRAVIELHFGSATHDTML
jgi:GntR family carbon starvation induced transcriptional regulator